MSSTTTITIDEDLVDEVIAVIKPHVVAIRRAPRIQITLSQVDATALAAELVASDTTFAQQLVEMIDEALDS